MAHIDNLISAIKDPQLRDALRTEYDKVNKTREFGLVFDRHQPETVVLPLLPVRVGEKVQVLSEGARDRTAVDGTGIWTVGLIDRGTGQAALRDADGGVRREDASRLVATREFGDRIYPGLRPTGRVVRGGGEDGDPGDKPFHVIINGENYHSLEALIYAHEGQVDAIYIDPPYNTGARDWKYNNDYVDGNDPYRHSKWLSFVEKRLRLAKRLLNPADSVLIVTIDEKEVHRLGLLIEQAFRGQRTQMVSIVVNHRGVARLKEFTRVEEYAIFVFIGDAGPQATEDDLLSADASDSNRAHTVRWEWLIKGSNNALRRDRPNLFYPVFIDPQQHRISKVGDSLPLDASRHDVPGEPGLVTVWPIGRGGEEKRWQCSPATLRSLIARGYARLGAHDRKNDRWSIHYLNRGQLDRIERGEIAVKGRDENGVIQLEVNQLPMRAAMSVWNRPAHNAGYYGSGTLSSLIPNRKFPFPKSLYAVEDTLRFAVGGKPDALIIDFFAGSGTTAHAVARLNHADGGRRRSILVTNNEVSAEESAQLRSQNLNPGDPGWEALGICQHITIPRIRAAFTGVTPEGEPVKGDYKFIDEFPMSDGFDENVEYFDLTYEDGALVSLGRRFEAIAPLFWLKAGAFGTRINAIDPHGWTLPDEATYGILFDTSTWPSFAQAVASRDDTATPLTHLFIVTDSIVEFQQIVSRLDNSLNISWLYADYLRSFEIKHQY
jgi:adenine-specific DNA-methyltransferase